ncbi:hypothetical protein [Mucilaginibacter arboris]|uniref:Uncharacterized protein n=1 Tax=Mucilaginibacter arboris TaxID=2682090 RepID=A0A7K1SZ59_9SPHI|nr:hypothetical protein [Mucilaginibacter arboris]MVN22601.1 hypothetical protein [Mucilaginibacter arboris]
MKNLFSILKTVVICFLIYKSLFYAFLFLVSGMWIITVLLLILFAYLCTSLFTEGIRINNYLKSFKQQQSFKHIDWKEKFSKPNLISKISKRFSSETA